MQNRWRGHLAKSHRTRLNESLSEKWSDLFLHLRTLSLSSILEKLLPNNVQYIFYQVQNKSLLTYGDIATSDIIQHLS